jgi:anti-sigma regulatory factor (Ser/Thr protein kinase)
MRRHVELPHRADAGAIARRRLGDWFAGTLEPPELQAAKLVGTEMVNNAVLHGQGKIQFQADLDDNRLRIEVIDQGPGFEHVAREVAFEQLSGRGLAIVEAEASRWGIHDGTTHVWAEVERAGPRVGKHAKVQP